VTLLRITGPVMAMLLAASVARAGIYDEAGVAAPFASIAVGARASGMGEAFTAVADDSTALFWNPAGLARIPDVEIQFSHNQWLESFRQEYFGAAFPMAGTFAAAYSIIDLGEYAELDNDGAGTGKTFSADGQVLLLGYGRGVFNDSLLAGATVKLIKEDLGGDVSEKAMSVDAGLMAVPWQSMPGVSLGACIQNFGNKITGFDLPEAIRVGGSMTLDRLLLTGEYRDDDGSRTPAQKTRDLDSPDALTMALDLVLPMKGRTELRVGAEYWFSVAAIRVGYRYRFPSNELGGLSGMTLGLGLKGRGFQFDYGFDYAYAPYGDLGNASRFTLSVSF
jgi:hypothetical protein